MLSGSLWFPLLNTPYLALDVICHCGLTWQDMASISGICVPRYALIFKLLRRELSSINRPDNDLTFDWLLGSIFTERIRGF